MWKSVMALAAVTVALGPYTALAANYQSPPPLDQIQPGDTLDYGDCDIRVIPIRTEAIGKATDVTIEGSWSNGQVVGVTDIWFVYAHPLEFNNGPKGYGETRTLGGLWVDYIRADITLYEVYGNYSRPIDSEIALRQNDYTSGKAWVEQLTYSYIAPAYIGFKATTTHMVIDADMGLNVSFATSDEF
ncbi:MAG: hypothetical protein K6U08_03370 [Firmicutes bacterium]|nr:hypothetical protein [Bacillota bacterium]